MTLTPVLHAVAEGLARDYQRLDRLQAQVDNAIEAGPWAMEALDIENVWDEAIEVRESIDTRISALRATYDPWIVHGVLEAAATEYLS